MVLLFTEKVNLFSKPVENLYSKLKSLNPEELGISEPGRLYLEKYIRYYPYFMSFYSQLLDRAIEKLNKPVSESTFIDYGGGCGILSFLAKESGFRTIVYNDIYSHSVSDAAIISEKLGVTIDYFICGDIATLAAEIDLHSIYPDLICSFDVLEHIYDIESWINTLAGIKRKFSLLFVSGANPCNPLISNRLRRLHFRSEYQGCEKNIRFNDSFLNTSFIVERKKIIKNRFSELNETETDFLAEKTRGLIKADIEQVITDYLKTGEIKYKIDHPTNTCDPYTGSWTERLIDLERLKKQITGRKLHIDIRNTLYSYSDNIFINSIKYLLNILIRLTGHKNLFFSPAFILEIDKLKDD
jgi:hypothetical protein